LPSRCASSGRSECVPRSPSSSEPTITDGATPGLSFRRAERRARHGRAYAKKEGPASKEERELAISQWPFDAVEKSKTAMPLRLCFSTWKSYVGGHVKPSGLWDRRTEDSGLWLRDFSPWFRSWTEDYEVLGERRVFLEGRRDRLQADAEPLVRHALGEHTRFQCYK
jgi:hypothetical protein